MFKLQQPGLVGQAGAMTVQDGIIFTLQPFKFCLCSIGPRRISLVLRRPLFYPPPQHAVMDTRIPVSLIYSIFLLCHQFDGDISEIVSVLSVSDTHKGRQECVARTFGNRLTWSVKHGFEKPPSSCRPLCACQPFILILRHFLPYSNR